MDENYKVFDITTDIDERIVYLQTLKNKLTGVLSKLPEGNLLVAPGSTNNSFRYYNRRTPQDKMGVYLGRKDDSLKRKLALKKYVKAACKNITKEVDKLVKIQQLDIKDSLISAFTEMNPGVKKLINPVTVDDKTYIKMWKDIPYAGLGFDENDETEFYSDLNERMRSKSEVAIANLLFHNGIPYKYECPVTVKGGEKLYPDFTILDVKRRRIIYWEHLGRMGDMSYVSKNIWKLDEYKKVGIYLGINLFVTFESGTSPVGTTDILRIINDIILS